MTDRSINGRIVPNPTGLCLCGCGERTKRRRAADATRGYEVGDYQRFVLNHHTRLSTYPFRHDGRRWKVIGRDGGDEYFYRVVMEAELGRPLAPDEHVHHVNGDRTDDRLENLLLIGPVEHARLHNAQRCMGWSAEYDQCRECGRTDRKHNGRGLCGTCYAAEWRRAAA